MCGCRIIPIFASLQQTKLHNMSFHLTNPQRENGAPLLLHDCTVAQVQSCIKQKLCNRTIMRLCDIVHLYETYRTFAEPHIFATVHQQIWATARLCIFATTQPHIHIVAHLCGCAAGQLSTGKFLRLCNRATAYSGGSKTAQSCSRPTARQQSRMTAQLHNHIII